MRGEFIFDNGLVIPNNITTRGAKLLGERALQGLTTPLMYVGLCAGVPTVGLQIQEVAEPAFTNGYARQLLAQNIVDWPNTGLVAGETYFESKAFVFAAASGNFSIAVTRGFIVLHPTLNAGDVFCLSAPLPAPLLITPATDVADRTFRYRVYTR